MSIGNKKLPLTKFLFALLLSLVALKSAVACTFARGWKAPSPSVAFQKAEQVVYGVVTSFSFGGTVAKLSKVRVLKGPPLKDDKVHSFGSNMCQIDLRLGQEYVIFIRSGTHVELEDQPVATPLETLNELQSQRLIPFWIQPR